MAIACCSVPLLSRGEIISDALPIFFVAQRDGDMPGAAAGNAQSGAGSGTSGSSGVVSGNPGASNVIVGSGWLGDYLGINRNGWRFAGLNITDANGLSGGLVPGWTADSLSVVDVSIDTEEALGWENGLIGGELLYYAGGPVNANAGTVLGYNSLDIRHPPSRGDFRAVVPAQICRRPPVGSHRQDDHDVRFQQRRRRGLFRRSGLRHRGPVVVDLHAAVRKSDAVWRHAGILRTRPPAW